MAPIPTELRQRTVQLPLADNEIEEKKEIKTIGINGVYYDITSFVNKHPGGDVITHFIDEDATTVFYRMGHTDKMLKHMKKVSTYDPIPKDPVDVEFDALVKKFKKEGYFDTDMTFYTWKYCFIAFIWALSFFLIICFDNFWIHCLGGVSLAFLWQQSGFVMHEYMHTQVTRNSKKDHTIGVFFGTVIFGMSAHWWRDEHIFHHSMTNTVDVKKNFCDPQMWEGVWAENKVLYPLFRVSVKLYFKSIFY